MTRKMIPVKESITEWANAPESRAAYAAQEEEFTLADALIRAREKADNMLGPHS